MKRSVLKLEIRPGESILIGDDIVVTLEKKSGQRARLSFEAEQDTPIRKAGSNSTLAYIAEHGLKGIAQAS